MSFIRSIGRECYHFFIRAVNYPGFRKFYSGWKVNVHTIDETVDYIIENKPSVARFGDGEFMVMDNSGNGFQTPNAALGRRLKEVFDSHIDNLLICVPNAFGRVDDHTKNAKTFWYPYFRKNQEFLRRTIDCDREYFNTSFTRFYISFKDKKNVGLYVEKMRRIWEGRDVVIVEGIHTLLGVGNDLFSNTASIERILGPAQNAFDHYDSLLHTVTESVSKDKLIICALGMTATVLCYDLAILGYQAIDIGHVDIEYCWYRMGAKRKVAIPGKAVNEVGINNPELNRGDEAYFKSIIARVK